MTLSNLGYRIEVDQITENEWMETLYNFNDASLFQSWYFGTVFEGNSHSKLTRLVVKKDDKIVAMAQGRIVSPPFLRIGVASFLNAPLWRMKGEKENYEVFRCIIHALKDEYAGRRGLLLRVRFNVQDGFVPGSITRTVFQNEGFEPKEKHFYRTILLNLSPSLEQLRKKLLPRWRRNLVKSEKKKLSIRQGTTEEYFEIFKTFHEEMFFRKKLGDGFNPNLDKYWEMQKNLQGRYKMIIMVCDCEGEPVAANLISAMGDTGHYLYGATSDKGIRNKLNASYLLHWKTIEWLQEQGYIWYDLRGYNPESYPGVSKFKDGFSGVDVKYAEFHSCNNKINEILVMYGEKLVNRMKLMRSGSH